MLHYCISAIYINHGYQPPLAGPYVNRLGHILMSEYTPEEALADFNELKTLIQQGEKQTKLWKVI